jgi:hypothetical protein
MVADLDRHEWIPGPTRQRSAGSWELRMVDLPLETWVSEASGDAEHDVRVVRECQLMPSRVRRIEDEAVLRERFVVLQINPRDVDGFIVADQLVDARCTQTSCSRLTARSESAAPCLHHDGAPVVVYTGSV